MTGNPRLSPPNEHRWARWHFLRDEDGELYIADWTLSHGWHGGWNGKLDPNSDDFDGWTYVSPVPFPGPNKWKQPVAAEIAQAVAREFEQ